MVSTTQIRFSLKDIDAKGTSNREAEMIVIKQMKNSDIRRIAEIDRSEHVTLSYKYKDGKLETQEVDWHVPRWSTDSSHEFSVEARTKRWTPILEKGGVMLGAFDRDLLVGFAILRYKLTESMAELAALYVSKDYRRQGIAEKLTTETSRLAKEGGARELYVSATPSQSAVGFYKSQGFRLAEKVNKELYELEPEDIHMMKIL